MDKIFNPEGLKPQEYRTKYPELKTIQEFSPLSDRDLVFVWYYSNPTSDIYNKHLPRNEKAYAAARETFKDVVDADRYAMGFVDGALKNQDDINIAIERMVRVRPDVRYEASEMVKDMFKDYKELLEKPLSDFCSSTGVIDHIAYLNVRKTIMKDLPDIIKKVEDGFGTDKDEKVVAMGQDLISSYLKNKTSQQ